MGLGIHNTERIMVVGGVEIGRVMNKTGSEEWDWGEGVAKKKVGSGGGGGSRMERAYLSTNLMITSLGKT